MTLNGPLPEDKFWEIRYCSKPWWFVMPDFIQVKNYFLGRMRIEKRISDEQSICIVVLKKHTRL